MLTVERLTQRFETVFKPNQAVVLADVFTAIYTDLVKTSDFNELKEIVRDLAVAQRRTEQRVEELAVAQQRTEQHVEELAVAQQNLTQVVTGMGKELGGLSRAMSYALENEAYRALPAYLERTYGITLNERIVRTEIDEQEINFFARGEQNGEQICLVGEAKLQIDERRENRRLARELFEQIERQAAAVAALYPGHRIVRLIVTHYARPAVLKQAQDRGVLVVQSFDW